MKSHLSTDVKEIDKEYTSKMVLLLVAMCERERECECVCMCVCVCACACVCVQKVKKSVTDGFRQKSASAALMLLI